MIQLPVCSRASIALEFLPEWAILGHAYACTHSVCIILLVCCFCIGVTGAQQPKRVMGFDGIRACGSKRVDEPHPARCIDQFVLCGSILHRRSANPGWFVERMACFTK